jgi:RHS repeat-associated protein
MLSSTSANVAITDRRVENAYDALGRRVRKTVKFASTGAVIEDRYFIYDGWNVIEETIAPATGPVETAEAVWGTDLSGTAQGAGGVGGLLLRESSATGASYYHYDGNGNVTALTSGAGTVQAAYTYGPFGETLRAVGPLAQSNPWRFSTKYQDDETGLLYYGYRFYNPTDGRWPNRDPIGEEGGVNMSAFVRNHAISSFDSDGRAEFDGNGPIKYNDASKRWQGADGKFVSNPGFPIPPKSNRDPKVPNTTPSKNADSTAQEIAKLVLGSLTNANKKIQLSSGFDECERQRALIGKKFGCGCCEIMLKFNLMFDDSELLGTQGVYEFAGARYSPENCPQLNAEARRNANSGQATLARAFIGGVKFPRNVEWNNQSKRFRDLDKDQLFSLETQQFIY